MTSNGPGLKSLRIQSDHEEARRARHWVKQHITAAGFSGEDRAECVLAFGEALSNVVRHACDGRPDEPIDIELQVRPDQVRIVIRDGAPRGFNPPREIKAPAAEDLAEGGYGVHLIQQLVDEVRYLRTGDGFNELHLLKRSGLSRREAS